MRARWGLATAVIVFALSVSTVAWAVNFTFTGSGAVEYRAFIGDKSHSLPQPSSIGIDSLTLEFAQKVVVDVTKDVNVNVKVCFGCHGVELDQGYAEAHVRDWLSIRTGRFNVPLGEFNVRHDPANYNAPSKPLPYAMGDMLRYRPSEFNLSVVPTPYSDNGIEFFGTFWIAHKILLDYSAYVVRGFVGTNDLNFIDSRQYVANKNTPSVGARLVATMGPVSLGGSFSWGYYDPNNRLSYLIYGADLYARWRTLTLRAEFIARQTDYDQSLPGYLFKPKESYFLKAGYYAELEWTPLGWLTVLGRVDGLVRKGMPLPESAITEDSAGIVRATAGVVMRFLSVFMVKAGYEYWSFYGTPFENQHVVRTAVIFTY